MLRTMVLAIFFLIFINSSASAQKSGTQIIESLAGEWVTVKWVNFENAYKAFTEEERNDMQFDSLNCVTARPAISVDSIVFDREKACAFSPCYNPFAASTVTPLTVISTTDQNQRKPGIEFRVGKISKYLIRLIGEDMDVSYPLLISTGCAPEDDKDRRLSIIYFNANSIAIYSSKDVIALKRAPKFENNDEVQEIHE